MDDSKHVGESSPKTRLQFSVRDLLVATTLVSICLAIGVHFAGFMFVFIVVGVLQVAMLLIGDWLIRPENRRALAFSTAGSWATVGSGLLVLGGRATYGLITAGGKEMSWGLAACLFVGAVMCYVLAALRWRQLTK